MFKDRARTSLVLHNDELVTDLLNTMTSMQPKASDRFLVELSPVDVAKHYKQGDIEYDRKVFHDEKKANRITLRNRARDQLKHAAQKLGEVKDSVKEGARSVQQGASAIGEHVKQNSIVKKLKRGEQEIRDIVASSAVGQKISNLGIKRGGMNTDFLKQIGAL